ncbi:uncharacterized protein LOC144704317 isoform X2 [Wolffia australiana]
MAGGGAPRAMKNAYRSGLLGTTILTAICYFNSSFVYFFHFFRFIVSCFVALISEESPKFLVNEMFFHNPHKRTIGCSSTPTAYVEIGNFAAKKLFETERENKGT